MRKFPLIRWLMTLLGMTLVFYDMHDLRAQQQSTLQARNVDSSESGAALEKGFRSLFDGRSLDGWHAVPEGTASDWSVQDGAVVGIGSADRLAYLVWKDPQLADFELRLRYRLLTKGNTGVEIRAVADSSGRRPFEGYHADIGHVGIGPNVLGAWDFHFAKRREHPRKEHPCPLGTSLIIDESDIARPSPIKNGLTVQDIRDNDWNDVRIVAQGNHFEFYINGKLASEFTDNLRAGRLDRGAIGLQLHNRGMRVEFKDIRMFTQ